MVAEEGRSQKRRLIDEENIDGKELTWRKNRQLGMAMSRESRIKEEKGGEKEAEKRK